MSYETNLEFFKFQKPSEWNSFPLYKKIAYYKTVLNKNYSPYVDKLIAKKIVKDLCGNKIQTAKVIRILNEPNDLHQRDLNINHIIKSSHGSGWNINIIPSTNVAYSKKLLNQWNIPYLIHNEEQYRYIKPQFFIEEKINDKFNGKNGKADVYMFRCINGEPITIGVKRNDIQNSYNINWEPITNPLFILEKPNKLQEMLEISKILSKPFEFVRIDFHLDNESNIYFSEFTFTPNAGYQLYPDYIEITLGALWK